MQFSTNCPRSIFEYDRLKELQKSVESKTGTPYINPATGKGWTPREEEAISKIMLEGCDRPDAIRRMRVRGLDDLKGESANQVILGLQRNVTESADLDFKRELKRTDLDRYNRLMKAEEVAQYSYAKKQTTLPKKSTKGAASSVETSSNPINAQKVALKTKGLGTQESVISPENRGNDAADHVANVRELTHAGRPAIWSNDAQRMRLTRQANKLRRQARIIDNALPLKEPKKIVPDLVYPDRPSENDAACELYAVLKAAGFDVKTEVTCSAGRLDMVVFNADKQPIMIVEIKSGFQGWNTGQKQKYEALGLPVLLHNASTSTQTIVDQIIKASAGLKQAA